MVVLVSILKQTPSTVENVMASATLVTNVSRVHAYWIVSRQRPFVAQPQNLAWTCKRMTKTAENVEMFVLRVNSVPRVSVSVLPAIPSVEESASILNIHPITAARVATHAKKGRFAARANVRSVQAPRVKFVAVIAAPPPSIAAVLPQKLAWTSESQTNTVANVATLVLLASFVVEAPVSKHSATTTTVVPVGGSVLRVKPAATADASTSKKTNLIVVAAVSDAVLVSHVATEPVLMSPLHS